MGAVRRKSDVSEKYIASRSQKMQESNKIISAVLFICLFFGPEDGSDIILPNVGSSLNYTALQP
jgi:hypothetical protein